MISDDYKGQLRELHASRGTRKWGTTGARNFGDYVVKFLEHRRGWISSVLDFGAGHRSLQKYVDENAVDVRVAWDNYDPGHADIAELPKKQFDLIISSDVLEHVEPEKIDETIAWMHSHADKALFHHIACDEAGMLLPDGRNVHLITERLDWWEDKFDHPSWELQYSADVMVKKRQMLRRHCHVQYDKV